MSFTTLRLWYGNTLKILAVCTITIVCLGQAPTSPETPKAKYSDVICTCTEYVGVGVNLIQKSQKELIIPNKNMFRIYEDGVLQEIVFYILNDDEVTKKLGFRYKLGYTPTNEKLNGDYRKVRIVATVKGKHGIKVIQSMNGYSPTKENLKLLRRLPKEEPPSSKGCCA